MTFLTKHRSGLCLLFLICIPPLLYFNTYQAEFHFDDRVYILESSEIISLSGCLEALSRSFFQPNRMLVTLSFALNYAFHGFQVYGYHLLNIFLHALNGCLIFLLLKRMLGCTFIENAEENSTSIEIPAFGATLLFIVHPLAVNSVTYISQRHVLLATFFFLTGFYLYIVAIGATGRRRLLLFLLCLVCYWGAFHCKPMALTLPFVLLGFEYIYTNRKERIVGRRIIYLTAICFSLSIFLGIYAYRNGLFDTGVATVGFRAENLWEIKTHFLTELSVFFHYIQLIFLPLPIWLCVDHSYPLSEHFDIVVFFSLVGHVAIIGLAVWGYVLKLRLITFGIFWLYLTLAIPYLFLPTLDVMVEYKTYLPSFGVFCLVAEGLRHVVEKKGVRTSMFFLLPALVFLSLITFHRNEIFKTEKSFWTDVIDKYPRSFRAYNNRGMDSHARGKYQDAVTDFKKALVLEPKYSLAHANIGDSYRALNSIERAAYHYGEYIRLEPGKADGYVRLGSIYALGNDWTTAIKQYHLAIERDPDDMGALYNLGLGLGNIGEKKEALKIFKKIVRRNPSHYKALTSLGVCYFMAGDRNLGAKYFKRALAVNPQYAEALFNLAAWHTSRNELENIRIIAKRLRSIEPEMGQKLEKYLRMKSSE